MTTPSAAPRSAVPARVTASVYLSVDDGAGGHREAGYRFDAAGNANGRPVAATATRTREGAEPVAVPSAQVVAFLLMLGAGDAFDCLGMALPGDD